MSRPAEPEAEGADEDQARPAETHAARRRAGRGPAAVHPHRHRDQHEAEQDAAKPFVARLRGKHPREIHHGRIERKRHELLERFHPRAGPREQFDRLREDRKEEIWRGEADADGR